MSKSLRRAVRGLWVGLFLLLLGGCGRADRVDDDADMDTISNGDEGLPEIVNTDGDAWEDWLDLDSDGDLIPDALEAGDDDLATPPVDSDGDGVPDFQDTDSDNDGVPDRLGISPDGDLIDTDGDGTPDFQDDDDDGDGILDTVEGNVDSDGDGVPNRLDTDSDNDGVPDAIEGVVDTDGDLQPDFIDADSDGDGIPDADEDIDGDGVVDPCGVERPCESSRTDPDTDGDGIPDLVERLAGSDPSDPMSGIPAEDFYFVLPFEDGPQDGVLEFSTSIRQADIFFSVDTTGSFGEEIAAIQATIDTLIVPGVRSVIADPGFGVGRFEDFPRDPFGLPSDRPFELLQPITTDRVMIMAGVDALPPAAGGLDTPEAGIEALYQWATGIGIPELLIDPFSPGDVGGAGFRTASLPIIVHITDARSHEPADYLMAGITTRGADEAVAALNAIGARVIGIRSTENDGNPEDPRAELEDLALRTNATIPPTMASCATGIDGAPRMPVTTAGGDLCPLVFDVRPDGTGLGSVVVDAIRQLASLGTLDISAVPIGNLSGERGEPLPPATTTADFIESITPEPPPPTGSTIDGDVFRDVTAGTTVRFRLTARNDFVRHTTTAQLFTIEIHVLGDAVAVLDVRTVYVIVPAEIEDPIIF